MNEMMDIYGFSFSVLELSLSGVLFLTFLHQLYFYVRYMNGVMRLRSRIRKGYEHFETAQPPVSVIICAKDEAENLRKFLPFVLEQDYPVFEVIVINDGSTDATDELLRELVKVHGNLKTTFVPVGANNLSTKKLAITLGIKASQYEYLLFTDADCMPEDKHWIASMMRNFSRETEFVLGYGAYLQKKTFLNRLITYDTLFIALQYMGMARAGKPYMGVGRNLAYRKETFYRQKGFAQFLGLASGDDDLMVNRAATPWNTKVEIAPESITWSEPNETFKGWLFQKQRHLSVSAHYTASSKFRLISEPMTRGLFYLFIILSLIFGGMIVRIAAAVLLLARFMFQAIIINRSSNYFFGRKYFFTIFLFDIYLPLAALYLKLFTKKQRKIYWK